MSNFKDRLVTELNELQDKINKLDAFMKIEAFNNISHFQQEMLKDQLIVMDKYAEILSLRIQDIEADG